MTLRRLALTVSLFGFTFYTSVAQQIDNISFDPTDSISGAYLAIAPQSKQIKAVLVLLTSFRPPAHLLTETKLQGVTYTNDILLVVADMKRKLYADQVAINRLNKILTHVQKKYAADTSKFALAGYNEAGNIALRYTELTYQDPSHYPLQPKAVFGIDTPVDLFGLWRWSERQIKKNYWPGAVGDAKFYLETMTKENGTPSNNIAKYQELTPFYKDADTPGNEQYLKNVAVRLYYDSEITWHLNNRRNSLYDTNLPDGSELISRLLQMGNAKAEFIASGKQGISNNGTRHPTSISIVDEVECVHWIKRSLGIFDPHTWIPPYALIKPKGWGLEVFSLPPDFANTMTYKGVEDIRFAPGWGDSTKADYWSYSYLWWLDGNSKIDAGALQENLQAYYAGLVSVNVAGRSIPAGKLVSTQVKIEKIKTTSGDSQTFAGNIRMLDYMTQKPITLNIMVHVKECISLNHLPVFIEVSPQPYKHDIWQQMSKIGTSFSCRQ